MIREWIIKSYYLLPLSSKTRDWINSHILTWSKVKYEDKIHYLFENGSVIFKIAYQDECHEKGLDWIKQSAECLDKYRKT